MPNFRNPWSNWGWGGNRNQSSNMFNNTFPQAQGNNPWPTNRDNQLGPGGPGGSGFVNTPQQPMQTGGLQPMPNNPNHLQGQTPGAPGQVPTQIAEMASQHGMNVGQPGSNIDSATANAPWRGMTPRQLASIWQSDPTQYIQGGYAKPGQLEYSLYALDRFANGNPNALTGYHAAQWAALQQHFGDQVPAILAAQQAQYGQGYQPANAPLTGGGNPITPPPTGGVGGVGGPFG